MVTLTSTHQKLRKMYDEELEYQFEKRDYLQKTEGLRQTPEVMKYQNMLTGLINNSCKRAQDLDTIISEDIANQEAA